MCGFVGFVGDGKVEDLYQILNLLSHRGPDGEGIHVDVEQKVFLGHRRLAIRDVDGGAQPMCSAEGRYVLVYNGEIYNDQSLRQELEDLGHTFSSASDTEVVLRAIIEWGEFALARLDGQFALCFLDKKNNVLILGRDRFGEKPLFWSQTDFGIVFASESNVLACHPWVLPELDEENCTRFLLMGYLPPPFSILKGVRQLRPGNFLRVELGETQHVSEHHFASPWDEFTTTEVETRENRLSLSCIDQAVDSRRVSDMEVGILLSGGVDSSLVANSAVRLGWQPATFTIGFSDSTYDEAKHATSLAEKLGLKNYQLEISSFSKEEVIRVLQSLDEPLADSSYIPTFKAFELSSSHSKVLLTGDGGDELFFGYEPFRVVQLSQILNRVVPQFLVRLLLRIVRRLPKSGSYMNTVEVLERFLDGLSSPIMKRVLIWMATLRTNEWKRFFFSNPTPNEIFKFVTEVKSDRDLVNTVRNLF